MSQLAVDVLTGAAALAGLAMGAAFWLRASASLVSSESRYERWLDRGLILGWLAVGFFYLLAGLGAFRLWTAVVVILGSGLLARAASRDAEPIATHPVRSLEPLNLRDPWLWASIPMLTVAAVRLVKGMAAPPMSWDAMTMHLPKPAFWIQSASLALPDFPDAWSYYRWFPAAGEVLFAWAMLPFRGDLLLGPLGALVWLAVIFAAARLARQLGASTRTSWLAGLALAGLPSVLVFMTASYVDNLVLLFVLLAVTHASVFAKTGLARNAVLSLGAAGLAIGAKTSALAMLAPVVATLAVLVWRRRSRLRFSAWVLMAAAPVLPCVGYLHTWIHKGSPLYPFRAPLLSLPYHQGLADLFAGRQLLTGSNDGLLGQVFHQLFWSPPFGQGHMNFGLGGALMGATALVGIALAIRRGGRLRLLWLTMAAAVVSTPLVFTEANRALWTIWVLVLGRHLLPAFAPLLLWSALVPGSLGRMALAASILLGSVHLLPLGWSPAMTAPALQIAAVLAVLVGTVIALRRLAPTTLGPRLRSSFLIVLTVASLALWTGIRAGARYEIYRETAGGRAFDAHPIHPTFATGASLWPLLDTARGHTLAVTVGKDPVGHNQFFYPLLGSRLQNRLVYVPVSDGDDSLEPAERYARADPTRWLADLDREAPDLVVGLWQVTPERRWLGQRPDEFKVVAFTSLGAPWVGRRRDGPPLLDFQAQEPPR